MNIEYIFNYKLQMSLVMTTYCHVLYCWGFDQHWGQLAAVNLPRIEKKKKIDQLYTAKNQIKKQTNYDLTIEKIIMFFKSADLEHDGKYLFWKKKSIFVLNVLFYRRSGKHPSVTVTAPVFVTANCCSHNPLRIHSVCQKLKNIQILTVWTCTNVMYFSFHIFFSWRFKLSTLRHAQLS